MNVCLVFCEVNDTDMPTNLGIVHTLRLTWVLRSFIIFTFLEHMTLTSSPVFTSTVEGFTGGFGSERVAKSTSKCGE
jgi:hypothetical protein